MPPVDRQLIAEKLTTLKQKVPAFREEGPSAARTVLFKNWESEIERWLRFGEGYTKEELFRLKSIQFQVPGGDIYEEWDSRPSIADWFATALSQAEHTLEQAIENLNLGLSIKTEPEKARELGRSAAVVNNINNSNVLNLNIQNVLEALATEIEKQDPREGKNLREMLKRWSENPVLRTILNTVGQSILRHYGGGGISV